MRLSRFLLWPPPPQGGWRMICTTSSNVLSAMMDKLDRTRRSSRAINCSRSALPLGKTRGLAVVERLASVWLSVWTGVFYTGNEFKQGNTGNEWRTGGVLKEKLTGHVVTFGFMLTHVTSHVVMLNHIRSHKITCSLVFTWNSCGFSVRDPLSVPALC